MTESHSNALAVSGKPPTTASTTARVKPAKPYPDFPLSPHATGYWCKKIRGRIHYFGKWADPEAALNKYLEQKDALHSGRTPRPDPTEPTLKDAANAFLNSKQALLDAGELSPRTWNDYKKTADLVVAFFGKRRLVADLAPDDFASLRKMMARKWSPVRLGNVIQRVRSIFRHAFNARLISAPVHFGPDFLRPSKKTLRLEKAKSGPRLFEAEEVRRLIAAAGVQLKAMILLAINCGFGNTDCGTLPIKALDLERGWVRFPRPKTGVDRRCPLWSETVAALKQALANRPDPKHPEDEGLAFVTKRRLSWSKDTSDNPVSKETGKLLRELEMNGRKGLGFYALRHTFRTVADEAKDQPAVDHIMGHESPSMASVYRERIGDDRLKTVTDHVRNWLFGQEGGAE